MKKITEESTIEIIKSDRIHYLLSNMGIKCQSVVFIAEIEFKEKMKSPTVQGIPYSTWLTQILENKIITDSPDPITVEVDTMWKQILGTDDPWLRVSNTDIGYVTKTLFFISQKVLDPGFEIKSLSYQH